MVTGSVFTLSDILPESDKKRFWGHVILGVDEIVDCYKNLGWYS